MKYLDKGLVELQAGGSESIKMGCVHWGGGDKGEIHLENIAAHLWLDYSWNIAAHLWDYSS